MITQGILRLFSLFGYRLLPICLSVFVLKQAFSTRIGLSVSQKTQTAFLFVAEEKALNSPENRREEYDTGK